VTPVTSGTAPSVGVADLEASIGGTVDCQTSTKDISDYLKQGDQTAGRREPGRWLETFVKTGQRS